MKTINELVDTLTQHPLVVEIAYKYRNSIELNGFILKKPKFFKHDIRKTESCSFLLYQITNQKGVVKLEIVACMTYVKELVAQLKTIDKVVFVATVGKVRYSKQVHSDYDQVLEMKTLYQLDLPLVE